MDVLSEVLRVVKLQGALFFNAEFSAPWCLSSSPAAAKAHFLSDRAGHVILFHFLTEGRAYARLLEGRREELTAGDIVIFPYGDSHLIGNGSPEKTGGLLSHVCEKLDSRTQTRPLWRWRRNHQIRLWIPVLRAAAWRGLSGRLAPHPKSPRSEGSLRKMAGTIYPLLRGRGERIVCGQWACARQTI